MKALYLESSSAVAWLFGEAKASDVIHRAVALKSMKEASAQKIRGLMARERKQWITMALTESVLARAGSAFPVEPVKPLDAIHLATALAFSETFPDLKIIAFDRRVSDNAVALGLASA